MEPVLWLGKQWRECPMSNVTNGAPAIPGASVPVTAEWALWGKTASDRGEPGRSIAAKAA